VRKLLIFHPEERTGNILFRAAFRPHVIPFLSGYQASETKNINIDDLYLSVEKGALVLKSKKHKTKILPYLSNAHNYSYTKLPIYRFLCDYQRINTIKNSAFYWGNIRNTRVKLPRVLYRNIILSKAKWNFTALHFSVFKTHLAENKPLLPEMKQFQKKWHLPKYVSLVQGDNTLLVDLENEFCLQMFMNEIRTKHEIVLEEYLGTVPDVPTSTNQTIHNNQMVFMFTSKIKRDGH